MAVRCNPRYERLVALFAASAFLFLGLVSTQHAELKAAVGRSQHAATERSTVEARIGKDRTAGLVRRMSAGKTKRRELHDASPVTRQLLKSKAAETRTN